MSKASAAFIRRHATSGDLHYAGRRRHASAAQRSLGGRALLRALLDDVDGVAAASWRIEADFNGKPAAIGPDGGHAPPISVSHSRQLVAACVGVVGQLGIDVEFHATRRPVLEIARSAFGPREIAEVDRNQVNFYRIWTLREAIAKATGAGLTRVADRTDMVADLREDGAWVLPSDNSGTVWRLASFSPLPEYSLGFAWRIDPAATDGRWSLEDLTINHYPESGREPVA